MISDPDVVGLLYLVTIVCFVIALRFLSSPKHARKGNWIGGAGMLVAIGTTLLLEGIGNWALIAVGGLIGGIVGLVGARRVRMTAMPQMVAIFNGVGGGAAALVALAEWHNEAGPTWDSTTSIVLSALIGSISFAGSIIAFAKLQELLSGRPIVFPGQNVVNILVLLGAAGLGVAAIAGVHEQWVLWALVGLALLFGVMFVLPIGGADMPVVISLLNAFTGIAASATGFVLDSTVLIVSGMLVGAAGTLLTLLMAKAMNRSIANVLFGAFGQVQTGVGTARADDGRTVRATTAEDVAVQLSFARKVVIVPGYGMAVAQAQHDVRQLADILESRGVDVVPGEMGAAHLPGRPLKPCRAEEEETLGRSDQEEDVAVPHRDLADRDHGESPEGVPFCRICAEGGGTLAQRRRDNQWDRKELRTTYPAAGDRGAEAEAWAAAFFSRRISRLPFCMTTAKWVRKPSNIRSMSRFW